MARRGAATPLAYISERIRIEDRGHSTPCWIWQRWLTEKGYARATLVGMGRVRVHRAVYEMLCGPIPDGLQIDHLCRVKSCCNPDHLEPVTNDENARRASPARRRGSCLNGHPYEGNRTPSGNCRTCNRLNVGRYTKKNRQDAMAAT